MSAVATPAAVRKIRTRTGLTATIVAIVASVLAYALQGLGLAGTTPANLVAYGVTFAVLALGGWYAVRKLARDADPVLYPTAVLLGGDPYPIYERMRAAGPVSFSPLLQQWAVVGYEEARQVLSSSSFGVAPQIDLLLEARPYSRMADTTKALLRNALLFTEPPLHTRLRSVINRAFTPPQMQRLEARVAAAVDRLLADIADDPVPDLVPTLTEPLPIQVIAELIGVPEDRWPWVTATLCHLATSPRHLRRRRSPGDRRDVRTDRHLLRRTG